MRVNINMPDDLQAEVDKKAKALNLSRSSYVTMIITQFFEQQKAMNTLEGIIDEIKKEQLEK